MSVPGSWLTPPGTYDRPGRVGAVFHENGTFTSGEVRDGGNDIGAALFDVVSSISPTSAVWMAGVAEVPVMLHSSRIPEDFGAFRPAAAVGFEWEDPAAECLSMVTTIPDDPVQVTVMNARGEVGVLGAGSRAAVDFEVRLGMIPTAGLTLSGDSVTATPGLTGPSQFDAETIYTMPGGSGDLPVATYESPWSRTIPTAGAHGWTVFVVTVADVARGLAPSGYQTAVARVNNYKTQVTEYAPTSRYRWLFDEVAPGGGTYGWGVRLV